MVKISTRELHQDVLKKYIPEEFVEYTVDLILRHPLEFRIVRPRKTKLGDFRYGPSLEKPIITINGNLNQYSFLITTLHELAHYFVQLEHRGRIKAHGKEWQMKYTQLIYPIIETGHLPKDIENALLQSLVNVKASSCTDLNLYRVLKQYNELSHEIIHLEELDENDEFILNGKYFTKGKLRRKRYLCTELRTRKQYLVSAIAEVEKIEKNER
jgi:SprT protein